jgi:alkylation response protein AidB-like acyl-CoA dehydrogenase
LKRVRDLRYQMPGFSRELWRVMCGLGWPALRLPEDSGGSGFGMLECCALAETLGAALTPEPVIGAALAVQGLAAIDRQCLDAALSGECLVLAAWQDSTQQLAPGNGVNLNGARLNGRKILVSMGAGADAFLVLTGSKAALMMRDAPGLSSSSLPTQDGGHYLTLEFDDTPATVIDWDPTAALAEATLSTAAYLVGLSEAALARTLSYITERVQFGVPIGSFQVLQHRAVDLKLQAELARASVVDAARAWDRAPLTVTSLAAVSRAKARASNTAMLITRHAIQMHGGIGYADEHDIGLYLRKAMVVAPAFGSAETHRRQFARLQPPTQTEA